MYIQKHNKLPRLEWDKMKSQRLKQTRGVSFEDIINQKLLDVIAHPKQKHQKIMLFEYKKYVWVVPFVDDGEYLFLKTIYPSRKLTKKYLQEKDS